MTKIFFAVLISLFSSLPSFAQELTPDKKKLIDSKIESIKQWAADAKVVEAVKSANANPQYKDMTQDKWAALPVLDPVVRGFSKNAAAEAMKKYKTDEVAEMFLNAADGTKVAFLSKTTSFSHKGKAKHDDPMSGKVWIGKVEVDESTGAQQVQVSVPVQDGGKVIGSLVVGLAIAKLK